MEGRAPEPETLATRLEQAAERLKAERAEPDPPSAEPPPAAPGGGLHEVLAGLAFARVEVRRARDRLDEIRDRLGLA